VFVLMYVFCSHYIYSNNVAVTHTFEHRKACEICLRTHFCRNELFLHAELVPLMLISA